LTRMKMNPNLIAAKVLAGRSAFTDFFTRIGTKAATADLLTSLSADNRCVRPPKGLSKGQLVRFIRNYGAYATESKPLDLSGLDLRNANLKGANLEGATLEDANLWDADLNVANIRNANLSGANLYYANLKGATLEGANLYCAYLLFAILENANLSGANLRLAILEHSTFPSEYKKLLTPEQREQVSNWV